MLAQRTASSQTFQQADGSFVTKLYTAAQFYRPAGSMQWQPIDLRFATKSGSGPAAVADSSPAAVSLGSLRDPGDFLSVAAGGHTIGFRIAAENLAAAAPSRPVIDPSGRWAQYANALPGGVDLRVFPRPDGVKSFLVLHQQPSQSSFTFEVDAPGLTLAKDADDILAFRDQRGTVIGRVPRPYMVDAARHYSNAVVLTIGASGTQQTLTMTPDAQYLAAASYPVSIDPTVTDLTPETTTIDQTFVSMGCSSCYYWGYQGGDPQHTELWLGAVNDVANFVFIQFPDLADALANVQVDSAILSLSQREAGSGSISTGIYLIDVPWSASERNWGSDPASHLLDTGDPNSADLIASSDIDLTDTVQGWLSGSNYGIELKQSEIDEWNPDGAEVFDADATTLSVTWQQRPSVAAGDPAVFGSGAAQDLRWGYRDDSTETGEQVAFEVQLSANASFDALLPNGDSGVVTAGDTSWTIPSNVTLTDATTYWWRVRASDGTTRHRRRAVKVRWMRSPRSRRSPLRRITVRKVGPSRSTALPPMHSRSTIVHLSGELESRRRAGRRSGWTSTP